MVRPSKLPSRADPGAVIVTELGSDAWAAIEKAAHFSATEEVRALTEEALAFFSGAVGEIPIEAVRDAALPLSMALFHAFELASAPEAAVIFDAAGVTDAKLHRALDDMVHLAGLAHHFANGYDFGTPEGMTAQNGVDPVRDLVRGLAYAFFIATGGWPEGISHTGGRNKGRPCFTSFLVACYESQPSDQRPVSSDTLRTKAGHQLREFLSEIRSQGEIAARRMS